MVSGLIKVCQNIDGCTQNYRCDAALFLLKMLSQYFNIIIYHGISAPGHGREVVERLNATDKSFIFHIMDTVQLPVSEWSDT